MAEEVPPATPEGVLIRRAREAFVPRMSIKAAARASGVSAETWGYTERGYRPPSSSEQSLRKFSPGDGTLAHMAYAVEVKPEELEGVDREDAAGILREIIRRQQAREQARAAEEREHERDFEIVRQMAEFFEDDGISADEKRIMAERFFKILPYYVAGQRPPRDLLAVDEDDPPANGSSQSA